MSSVTIPRPVVVDSKELAGAGFAGVVKRTGELFPDSKYRPTSDPTGTRLYLGPHQLSVNSDGTGTKPELAERLYEATGDASYFERPAHDVVAMVADDAARHGQFTLGIVNCVDVSSADNQDFVAAMARGMEAACRAGRFALINGETAELGYRVPGPGDARLNWNSVALALVNLDKVFRSENLRPGQPLVALRETTIRSNGLTRARAILEHVYLAELGVSRDEWIQDAIARRIGSTRAAVAEFWQAMVLEQPGFAEQLTIPWHLRFADLTEQLSRPSTIYSPVIHDAQGGVDGPVAIPLIAATHVTGGGIPLKVKRMLGKTGLGAAIETVFPDPAGIPELLELAARYPRDGRPIVDQRSACEQWNRGVGFLCVARDTAAAHALVELAGSLGYQAAIAGQIVSEPVIRWRGESWRI
jgi:phosphoribosylaminoimidazole (AIR) synthetase